MRRPLLIVALLYVSGILAAAAVELPPLPLALLALGVAVLAAAWARVRLVLLGALLVLAGWTNSTLHTAVLSPNDLRALLGPQSDIVTVRGILCESPSHRVYEMDEKESWRTLARVEVNAMCANRQSWRPATGRIAVTTPGLLTNFFAGQTVEVTGVAALPRIAVADGTFDYRAFLKQQGIYYQLKAESEADWRVLRSPAPPLSDRFRDWARRALSLGLPGEDENLRLEWALTLGWKTALTEQVAEPFVQAATYHIFAVDGLRMAIIFGIFFGLFRALRIPRPVCGGLLLPLIWFYVALTGWPASAIRACVMLTVVIVGWMLRRPSDLLNSLLAAAVIILVWQPQQLFQAGFQLSFFVVLCMILLLPPLRAFAGRLTAPNPLLPPDLQRTWPAFLSVPGRFCEDLLLTSFAAWLGSLPLVACYFHILTPVSTPANLVAVPLCALVLICNLSSLLLAGWFSGAAVLFNHAGWFLMECIRVSSHWFAHWPAAYYYVPAPSLFTSGLYYALLLAVATGWLFRREWRAWKQSALTLFVCVWCGLQCWDRTATCLTVLPVNGGMAIYFDGPGQKGDWVLDSGNTNAVEFIAKPFLRAQGVNRLATLLLSHGDLRHIGGAGILARLFSVNQVCASPVRFRSPAYRRLLEQLEAVPGLLRRVSRGDRVGSWAVLHPEPQDRFPQADDNALVLLGTVEGTRILLLSDLGRPGQNALIEREPDLRADIIVAGLPTATEALSDALLDLLQPRAIIIADSEFPVSERAGKTLRERLARRGAPVLYTRFSGAATIELRPTGWEIRTMEGDRLTSRDVRL
jgi:competence protein ComEC